MRVLRRLARALVVGTVLLAGACGGGDEGGQNGFGFGDLGGGDGDSGEDGFGNGGDELEISVGGELPDYFPADFYVPDGMTVGGVTRVGEAISLTGTFESGDIDAIQADMVAGLEAARYELLSNEDSAVFVKNGVGRVRVRTSVFLDELTVSVDIDTWTDAQLDELRALFAEEVVVRGRATSVVDGETYEAEGECRLQGVKRWFLAGDGSISLQIDETQDPTFTYADVTTPDGVVFTTEPGAELAFASSDAQLTASGDLVELYGETSGTVSFSTTATCET